MDIGRTADQDRNSRLPAGGAGQTRGGAGNGFLPPVVIVLLSAVTFSFWMASVLLQAFEIALNDDRGSAAIFMYPEPGEQQRNPRDIEEERPEPPIADAARSEGPARA